MEETEAAIEAAMEETEAAEEAAMEETEAAMEAAKEETKTAPETKIGWDQLTEGQLFDFKKAWEAHDLHTDDGFTTATELRNVMSCCYLLETKPSDNELQGLMTDVGANFNRIDFPQFLTMMANRQSPEKRAKFFSEYAPKTKIGWDQLTEGQLFDFKKAWEALDLKTDDGVATASGLREVMSCCYLLETKPSDTELQGLMTDVGANFNRIDFPQFLTMMANRQSPEERINAHETKIDIDADLNINPVNPSKTEIQESRPGTSDTTKNTPKTKIGWDKLTEGQLFDFKKAWEAHDLHTDDGFTTAAELRGVMSCCFLLETKPSDTELQELINDVGADANRIDFPQFLTMMANRQSPDERKSGPKIKIGWDQLTGEQMIDFKKAWEAFDLKTDGFTTATELRNVMSCCYLLEQKPSDTELKKLINDVGADANRIDFPQFLTMMANRPQKSPPKAKISLKKLSKTKIAPKLDFKKKELIEVKLLPNNFEEGVQWAQEQVGIALLSKWDKNGDFDYQQLIDRIFNIFELNPWMHASIKCRPPPPNAGSHAAHGVLSMQIFKDRHAKFAEKKDIKDKLVSKFIREEVNSDFFNKSMKDQMDFAEKFVVKAIKDHLKDKENTPLSKITIIRNGSYSSVNTATKFAIIVSINHLLGDGGTLYQVYNMLSADTQPQALQYKRVPYENQLKSETSFVCKDGSPFLEAFFGAHMMPFMKKSIHRARVNYDGRYDVLNWIYKINLSEVEKIKLKYMDKNSPDYEASVPFISTNDVIVSWLFNFNKKADYVVVAADLRERLSGLKDSARFLAGNYIITPTLRSKDIKNPVTVRKGLEALFNKTTNGNGYLDIPTDRELMKYNTGTSTNWVKFYKSVKIPGLKLEMCLPHQPIKLEKFMGVYPCVEESVIIFQMNDDELGMLISAGSGRLTTEKIERSGMVGEAIMNEVNLWPKKLLKQRMKNKSKMPAFNCFYPTVPKDEL